MSLLAQDEALTRKVGAATLLLLAAAIGFVVFVYDEIEIGARTRVEVYFRQSGGLREGAPFVVAGQSIGEIESIALAPRDPKGPLGGDEGIVATIVMHERDAKRIVRGGDVFVTSRGAFGARYLEIGPAPNPDGPTLADDPRPIVGRDPPTIDRVLQRTWDNLNITRDFADAVRPEMDNLRARLAELSTTLGELSPNITGVAGLGLELQGFAAEARKLRDVELGGDDGLAKLQATVVASRAMLAHARTVLDELGAKAKTLTASTDALRARLGDKGAALVASAEQAIERIRAAIDKIDPLLAKVEDINARIARGEGSLAKLARDPEFPEDAKALGKELKRHPWRVIQRPQK